LMNPLSKYYLAINAGFPNEFDKANHRDGSFLMIHGDCLSIGCYAMTDEQIEEIYSLARDPLLDGQESFQIQAYPFRMTPANLARHRTNPNIDFWKILKIGNDHFEATHLEPKVEVCDRRYVFDAQQTRHSSNPLVFDAAAKCPGYIINPGIAPAAREKQHADEVEYKNLVKANVPVAPIHRGKDGGMNRVFLDQIGGSMPPANRPLPGARPAPPRSAATAENDSSPHNAAPTSEPRQTAAAQSKPAPSQADAAPRLGSGTQQGAPPIVPADSFVSRWGGFQ
jgi:hypothetical protein